MDVRATIAEQLVKARGARSTGSEGQGERGSRWVNQQTGMHRDTLGRIERGIQPPTVAQARQLCALYGTRPGDLPLMAHVPTKAERLWATQMVTTLTVEQVVALAWAHGDSVGRVMRVLVDLDGEFPGGTGVAR